MELAACKTLEQAALRGLEGSHSQHLQPCSKSSQANVTPSIKEPATQACRSSSTHAAPINTHAPLYTLSQDHLATEGLPQRSSKAASSRGRDQSHLRRDGLGDDAGQSRRPRAPAPQSHAIDAGQRHKHAGFGESTDAFPLPKGYSLNPDLQAHPHASSEIGIGSEDPMKGPQK